MKISEAFGIVTLDVQTKNHGGGSACLVANDENTRVMHGNIGTFVEFLDLGILIKTDPTLRGADWRRDWRKLEDLKWAREQAWKAVRAKLTAKHLQVIITAAHKYGVKSGEEQLQRTLRRTLGISDFRSDYNS